MKGLKLAIGILAVAAVASMAICLCATDWNDKYPA